MSEEEYSRQSDAQKRKTHLQLRQGLGEVLLGDMWKLINTALDEEAFEAFDALARNVYDVGLFLQTGSV